MSPTRLSNIEKRLEDVAAGIESVHGRESGNITNPSFIVRRAARRTLPLFVAVWSIVELSGELILAQSPTERLASVAGRLIWIALAIGTVCEKRLARAIFLFLCAVNSFVVALALPTAYESSTLIFSVLAVDLALKMSALFASLILDLGTSHPR